MLPAPSILTLFVTVSLGCQSPPANPSFPLTTDAANRALAAMRARPVPTARPLLILGGYHDPHIGAPHLKRKLDPLFTNPDAIVAVSLDRCTDFDDCRKTVLDAVNTAFPPPSRDSDATVEVDVVGISMGGLAARHAAAPIPGQRRLRVARLFTIATPHCGAELADLPTTSQLQRAMRFGSPFLQSLPAPDYPVYPYVLLGDRIVGAPNASLPGDAAAWWLHNESPLEAHLAAIFDARIRADVARRLRNEPPFSTEPRSPLPPDD